MKLGIYVGSFNPPHDGHMHVVNFLLSNSLVDKVLLLATPNYWNKTNLVSMEDRVNMLNFLVKENIIVDTKHNKYPYTYQVLEAIEKDYPNDELYLILGADNLEKLHLWKNINRILKYKIIVLKRGNINRKKFLKKFNTNNFILVNNFDYINISSTKIRNNINGDYLDSRVHQYIKEHKLYETEE